MFTEQEKVMLLDALMGKKAGLERAKSKARNPRFAPIYEEDLKALAALAMKVQSLEVKHEGKVQARS